MPTERRYTRAEMLAKPVSRVQMFANRSPYSCEAGSAKLANHDTAREIFADYQAGKLIIENGFFKPKTTNTVKTKRNKHTGHGTLAAAKRKPRSASATIKKAQKIYQDQKDDYSGMIKTKVRQGKKVTTAAKEASYAYKKMYGATPTARWKRALRMAKM